MTNSNDTTPTDYGAFERQFLSADQQEAVASGETIAARLGKGVHLDDWLGLVPALMAGRHLAMKVSHSNSARGARYNRAFGHWIRLHPHLNAIFVTGQHHITALLWLHDEPERITTLARIRAGMTSGERARFAAPKTAMARVRSELEGAARASQEKPKEKKPTALEQNVALQEEIETLRHQLKDARDDRDFGGGGHLDLESISERGITELCERLLAEKPLWWAKRIERAIKAMQKALNGKTET